MRSSITLKVRNDAELENTMLTIHSVWEGPYAVY